MHSGNGVHLVPLIETDTDGFEEKHYAFNQIVLMRNDRNLM